MKVKVTTTVDMELKQMFDTFTSVHKKTYQDILERGMRQELIECKNSALIDAEIAEKKRTASSLLQEADALTIFKTKLGELKIEIQAPVIGSNGNHEALEKRREDVFRKMTAPREEKTKTKGMIIIQPDISKIIAEWESGNALIKWEWSKLVEKCGFESKDEAVAWFDKKIRELAAKQETLPSS